MLPLMLRLYVGRLKEAGAPLEPRISSETANHLGFIEGHLAGRQFFVGHSLTGADVQMSFPLEAARARGGLDGTRPKLMAFLEAIHARPAYRRAIEKGGEYALLK